MSSETSDIISKKVQESLTDGPYACSSFTRLSGGTGNFVFRGILVTPLEDGSKSVVVKHTESYVASNPAFKLTTSRCVSCYVDISPGSVPTYLVASSYINVKGTNRCSITSVTEQMNNA